MSESNLELHDSDETLSYPLLPLRDVVVFPHMVIPLFVGRPKSIKALEVAMESGKHILLVAQKSAAKDDPTPEERRWVRQYYGLQIPEDAIDDDIEESARFFEEDNGELHIRSDFLADVGEDEPRSVRAAFILNLVNDDLRSKGVLFSIHEEDIPAFRLLRMRARRMPGLIEDSREVLLRLFDGDVEYSADALEGAQDALEEVSAKVLKGDVSDEVASEVLATIARQENLNGMIRRSVMDTRRALSFMMRSKMLRRPRAPVLRAKALRAIAFSAEGRISSSTPSRSSGGSGPS